MAKLATAPYRLIMGTHQVPNPNFQQDKDDPVESHVTAKVGDIVHLNEDQFKAFKHKFRPVSTEGTDTRDADAQELEDAKVQAALTGQTVDPNKLGKAEDPFAAARAGSVPTKAGN